MIGYIILGEMIMKGIYKDKLRDVLDRMRVKTGLTDSYQAKVENEVVAHMSNLDEDIVVKEVKEKLVKIHSLASFNPEEVEMENIYKEKLEEIVILLNDPDETVMVKEVKEKLGKIVADMNNPEKFEMEEKERKKKMEEVVALLNNTMVNPDIELEYYMPKEATTPEDHFGLSRDPYVHLEYMSNGTHIMKQNVRIGPQDIKKTPEDIANLVTFHMEQFIEEIDSTEYGAQ